MLTVLNLTGDADIPDDVQDQLSPNTVIVLPGHQCFRAKRLQLMTIDEHKDLWCLVLYLDGQEILMLPYSNTATAVKFADVLAVVVRHATKKHQLQAFADQRVWLDPRAVVLVQSHLEDTVRLGFVNGEEHVFKLSSGFVEEMLDHEHGGVFVQTPALPGTDTRVWFNQTQIVGVVFGPRDQLSAHMARRRSSYYNLVQLLTDRPQGHFNITFSNPEQARAYWEVLRRSLQNIPYIARRFVVLENAAVRVVAIQSVRAKPRRHKPSTLDITTRRWSLTLLQNTLGDAVAAYTNILTHLARTPVK